VIEDLPFANPCLETLVIDHPAMTDLLVVVPAVLVEIGNVSDIQASINNAVIPVSCF
jgi:hypothetical protein